VRIKDGRFIVSLSMLICRHSYAFFLFVLKTSLQHGKW